MSGYAERERWSDRTVAGRINVGKTKRRADLKRRIWLWRGQKKASNFSANMSETIIYDAARKRSTDAASGLVVQWVRDEPPMERQTHFKLIVNGQEIPFVGYYNHGEDKIDRNHPGIAPMEHYRLTLALQEINYSAVGIPARLYRALFVRVWRHLLSQGRSVYRVSTYYTEYRNMADPYSKEEWSCEGEHQPVKP